MKAKRATASAEATRSNTQPATTRRSFVVAALGSVTAAAFVEACGGESSPGEARGGASGTSGTGAGGSAGTNASGAGGTNASGAGGTNAAGASGSGAGGTGTGDAGGAAGTDGGGGCTLYPQQTQGPYYLDLDLLRNDITEGKPGLPLTLMVQVLSAASCAPIAAVAIDIWQCDAAGVYSGFPGQLGGLDTTGQKFLRGTQVTDGDGRVQFQTIYPGWYPGRTTHIHFTVHISSTSAATSQMYFHEDVTSDVYNTSNYLAHGQKDTTNTADSVTRANVPTLLAISKTMTGYEATLVITVAG